MTLTDGIAVGAFLLAAWGAYSTWKNKNHSQPLNDYQQAIDIAQSAADSVKDMQIQIDALKAVTQRKDKIIFDWAVGIRKLVHQMRAAGMVPCWEPDPITLPRPEE
jgi:hypothetical protein